MRIKINEAVDYMRRDKTQQGACVIFSYTKEVLYKLTSMAYCVLLKPQVFVFDGIKRTLAVAFGCI